MIHEKVANGKHEIPKDLEYKNNEVDALQFLPLVLIFDRLCFKVEIKIDKL